MQESGEAAPTCTYGRFPIERDNAQNCKETGCRKATYHEDENSGRQQAFEISSEVSALILLCSNSVRDAILGTCTWYEWCGELTVIKTKMEWMGLGQCEHCSCWSRGVPKISCKRRVGLSSRLSTNQRCPSCDFGAEDVIFLLR